MMEYATFSWFFSFLRFMEVSLKDKQHNLIFVVFPTVQWSPLNVLKYICIWIILRVIKGLDNNIYKQKNKNELMRYGDTVGV